MPSARAYYNENEPYAAQWLRNLIQAGHIAPGEVDERDIRDVRPDELAGFTQCHFFAGIGVWSYALRLAGWPDNRPVWTGSCPCQPFSTAGRRGGAADERHLWPHWFHLISQRRPSIVFGEQVASKDGLSWFDLVQADMEGLDYACGAVPFPSAGVGAPHIRDRNFWVADTAHKDGRARKRQEEAGVGAHAVGRRRSTGGGTAGGLDNATGARYQRALEGSEGEARNKTRLRLPNEGCRPGGLASPTSERHRPHDLEPQQRRRECAIGSYDGDVAELDSGGRPGPVNGFWRDADWLFCTDGKWRPVEPGTFPLADGVANRVGQLRAYGNAINAEAATEFILAYREVIHAESH